MAASSRIVSPSTTASTRIPVKSCSNPACGTGGFLTCAIRHVETDYVRTPKQRERMQGALRATDKKQLPHMLCVTNMLLHGIEEASTPS